MESRAMRAFQAAWLFAGAALVAALGACSSSSDDAAADDGGGATESDAAPTDEPAATDDGGSDAGDPAVDVVAQPDAAATDAPPPTYVNPVLAHDFPDPFVLRENGMYYAFATNARGKNVQAAQSTDLASWSDLPDALPMLPAWAAKNAGLTWAPSVLKRGGAYVLYYTARDVRSGFQCISRATSSYPGGPYVDTSTAPFVCQVAGSERFCGSIDPSPFVDRDGAAYLLWKSDENASACASAPRLWSAPLTADGLALAAPGRAVLAMDQAWEQPIIEGPTMTLHDGVYFLFYSANAWESAAYAMGYATCLSPTGPCQKVTVSGPLVKSAGSALGPGGGELFTTADGALALAYHAWTAPATTYASGGARSLRIDPIGFDGGAVVFAGPTTTAQPLF